MLGKFIFYRNNNAENSSFFAKISETLCIPVYYLLLHFCLESMLPNELKTFTKIMHIFHDDETHWIFYLTVCIHIEGFHRCRTWNLYPLKKREIEREREERKDSFSIEWPMTYSINNENFEHTNFNLDYTHTRNPRLCAQLIDELLIHHRYVSIIHDTWSKTEV